MRRALTLVELLAAVAVVAALAAILLPVFERAREAAHRATCLSNLRQVGLASGLYLNAFDERLPDRRDLKLSLPGGYRPWTGWPRSDPRAGWAMLILEPYVRTEGVWSCPSVERSLPGRPEVEQASPAGVSRYWMWRFDRYDDPVPLDNFWGKTLDQAVADLRGLGSPFTGTPEGPSEVEFVVDPYFPSTIPTVPPELKGKTPHVGGRNRLALDGSARFLPDHRTRR